MSAPTALRVLLLVTLAAVGWLIHPYFQVLTIALITAVLAAPVHVYTLRLFRGRDYTAAVATMLSLVVGVFGPLGGVTWLLSRELVGLGSGVVATLREGGVERAMGWLSSPRVAAILNQLGIDQATLPAQLADAVQQASVAIAGALAASLPNVVSQSATVLFDVLVFAFSVITLLARGPALLAWIARISPLDPRYQQRLFAVFADFARNVVLAGLVCSVLQGGVAALGFTIAGVDRAFTLGVLTGVLSHVPFIGTALVWFPLVVQFLLSGQVWRAVFLLVWSVAVTASIDNIVRPFIVRGQSGIHPLLILLGVLGGLRWLGLVGVLIGPVLIAMLLTLLKLYTEEVASSG